jgi:hypothetical protein
VAGAEGILGTLRILVDADSAKAERVLKSFGGKAQMAGAALGAAIGGAAIAGLKLGDQYDGAMDSMRAATGATGDEFSRLEGISNSVAGRVTANLDEVTAATTSLYQHTRDASDATVESLVDLSKLTETGTGGIESVTALYAAWNVAAEDQVAVNDMLLRAYQASGVGVDALSDSLAKNAVTLRDAGLGLEESTTLLAGLEQAGVDANAIMGPLRKSIGNLIKAGEDPKEAVQGLFDAIKDAPDDVAAGKLALESFGAKGVGMASLIRDGTLDVGKLWDTIANGEETVQGAADDTRDWADGFKELTNKALSAIGPVTSVFAGLSDAMGSAIYLLPALGGGLGKLGGKFAANMGPKLMAGMKGIWGRVLSSSAVTGAIALAGAAAGRIYAAASTAGDILAGALKGVWARTIGSTAAGAGVAAAASGLAASIGGVITGALAALFSAGGAIAVGLGAAIGVAIGSAIAGPEVAKAIEGESAKVSKALEGMVTDADFDHARAVVNKGIEDINGAIFGLGSVIDFGAKDALRQQLADIDAAQAAVKAKLQQPVTATVPVNVKLDPDPAATIRQGFRAATREAGRGFGNVRDALNQPMHFTSIADRLRNQQGMLKQVMSRMRAAIKVGDPAGIAYWDRARAKVQGTISRLKGTTAASLSDVRASYKAAGISVKGTWAEVASVTKTKTDAAQDSAVTAAQDTKTGIDAVNLYGSGVGLTSELASGMRAGIPNVRAAGYEVAAAAAGPMEAHSPPREGPLSRIDEWGGPLVDSWLGGISGREGAARRVGARLAGAVAPHASMRSAVAGIGSGGGGGGTTIINVGTLVADDRGIDQLQRRMSGRTRLRERAHRRYNEPS